MTQPPAPPHTPPKPQRFSHDIEYLIKGNDIQYVEVILDPGESVVAENGAMIYFDDGIQMDTKLSDGSQKNAGIFGAVLGAAKRKIAGEGAFLGFYTNRATTKKKVAFAAPYPGAIIAIDLSYHKGTIYCQKNAFLCGAKGISVNVGITKKLGAGLFGGEGFILQSIQGDGLAFVHASGSVEERVLAPQEKLYVDTGCIVGFDSTVKLDIKVVTGFKNLFFGQENLFLATLEGPGKVWLQSMPFNELVATMGNAILNWVQKQPPKKR